MKLNKPLQKAKLSISSKSTESKEFNEFAADEFQKLRRRKLGIPVKLFHL